MWFFQEATGAPLPSADSTFDFSAALPTSFSLSRAGATALGRNSTGRWVAFPADTPRSWYDPVTLSHPYTLIEPERTQLLFRTRQPTPAVIQSSSTLDTGVQTPFGLGSVLYVPNATSTTHGWNLFFGTSTHGTDLADNTTVAMTSVLKPTGAYTDITFLLLNRTGIYSSVRVSLQGTAPLSPAQGSSTPRSTETQTSSMASPSSTISAPEPRRRPSTPGSTTRPGPKPSPGTASAAFTWPISALRSARKPLPPLSTRGRARFPGQQTS